MRTATLDVRDLLSILDFAIVEKRLKAMPGVSDVSMNAGSYTASVTLDDRVTDTRALAAEIEACGFHCRGELAPRHLCAPDSEIVPTLASAGHDDHAGHDARPAPSHDAMAHEMGHGAGMGMQDMVRDMRNRFLVSLVFTLPILAMDPMGLAEPFFEPPFGLSMNVTMFLFASAAILYPVWPFLVSAWRALRTSRGSVLYLRPEARHGGEVLVLARDVLDESAGADDLLQAAAQLAAASGRPLVLLLHDGDDERRQRAEDVLARRATGVTRRVREVTAAGPLREVVRGAILVVSPAALAGLHASGRIDEEPGCSVLLVQA